MYVHLYYYFSIYWSDTSLLTLQGDLGCFPFNGGSVDVNPFVVAASVVCIFCLS